MQTDIATWQKRSERMLAELNFAIQRAPGSDLLVILAAHPLSDFVQSVGRRATNIGNLAARFATGVFEHAVEAREAARQGALGDYFRLLGDRLQLALKEATADASKFASRIASSPREEALRVGAFALTALVASGGPDGDGGLPDTDIALLGIEAHRSPFTHSILAGAACEALINTFIRVVLHFHQYLPPNHDPVWDKFTQHSQELLDAISRGVSAGLAYHLLIDGLVQPAPYHDLPLEMPIEVHQALLAANGLMEGIDAATRPALAHKTPELVQTHRLHLHEEFLLVDDFAEWLSSEDHRILRRQGSWMYALSIGQIAPYTEKQAQFVAVAWQLLPPTTHDELAWARLVNLVRIATWKPPSTLKDAYDAVKGWVQRTSPFA